MRHFASFIKAPVGYIINLLATVDAHVPGPRPDWFYRGLCGACESFCIRDGVQDSPLF